MSVSAFNSKDLHAVEINAHVAGGVATLHWLSVPENRRRQGLGTAAYRVWEAGLPQNVRLVRLFAADAEGAGNSDDFWSSLGFRHVYRADDDLDYESAHAMHKGVNGARTPRAR